MRSCWKLPLCSKEPTPAGSKTDPPPAKAEPISDSGNAPVVTFLRRKKAGKDENGSRRKEREHVRENNPADTKVSEEGGGGDAPGTGAEIPLQPVVGKTMVRQAVPLQRREVHGGADLHLQPGEDPTPEQGDA